MQKTPSSGTGPFGRPSIGGECSVTPPISQFVTLSFGSRAARWWPSRLVATATENRLSFNTANNGQQGKSPGSEAGARLGFVCHGVTRDESDGKA